MQDALHTAWTTLQAIAPFLVLVLIPSLINALLPYPRAGGVVRGLHVALDVLSVLVRKDSPGTLKLPLTSSPMPGAETASKKGAASRPGMGALLLLVGLMLIPSCGTTSSAKWMATGIGTLKCVAKELGQALVALLDAIDQSSSPDYAQLGKQLATTYGVEAAVCAVEEAWLDLGHDSITDGGAPPKAAVAELASTNEVVPLASAPLSPRHARRLAALDWLVHHEHLWARSQ